MKKEALLSLVTAVAIMGVSAMAEPGNFGVNGQNAWNQAPVKRVKEKESFGDTFYTYKKEATRKGIEKALKNHTNRVAKAPKEVVDGLKATLQALQALGKDDIKTAQTALQKADKLFNEALKKDPALKMVPIAEEIAVKEFDADTNQIQADITLADGLLKHHKTQLARDILLPMEDEIDITTRFLPMDTYPIAVKKALDLLKKGKKEACARELMLGFGTVTAEEVVIPIPLLTAQELVKTAEKIAAKDPKTAILHLKEAKKELHRALLLGYTDKNAKAYQSLYDQMTKLQKQLRAKSGMKGLFGKLKKDFKSLLEKTQKQSKPLGRAGGLHNNLAKAHAKAAKEETEDKLRFEEEQKSDVF
ncbi:MAG: YfdX family protein [Epsilonproteobacteria bacterium]|nr:YfdX family protein [Campylobacterota bacterium]